MQNPQIGLQDLRVLCYTIGMKYAMILTTCPNRENAVQIANLLLKQKLAACVQLQEVESFYTWEGEPQNGIEILLSVKTRADKFQEVEKTICAAHPYTCPQIIQLPIENGFQSYLAWIDENVV